MQILRFYELSGITRGKGICFTDLKWKATIPRKLCDPLGTGVMGKLSQLLNPAPAKKLYLTLSDIFIKITWKYLQMLYIRFV